MTVTQAPDIARHVGQIVYHLLQQLISVHSIFGNGLQLSSHVEDPVRVLLRQRLHLLRELGKLLVRVAL